MLVAPQLASRPTDDVQPPQRIEQKPRRVHERRHCAVALAHGSGGGPRRSRHAAPAPLHAYFSDGFACPSK